jgi:hypothetical protein
MNLEKLKKEHPLWTWLETPRHGEFVGTKADGNMVWVWERTIDIPGWRVHMEWWVRLVDVKIERSWNHWKEMPYNEWNES